MTQPLRRSALPLLTLVFSGLLLACGSPGHAGRHGADSEQSKAAAARAERLSASGYRPAEDYSLALSLQRWMLRGEALPVSLLFPAGNERGLPLIVYLPGLGESAQAGAR